MGYWVSLFLKWASGTPNRVSQDFPQGVEVGVWSILDTCSGTPLDMGHHTTSGPGGSLKPLKRCTGPIRHIAKNEERPARRRPLPGTPAGTTPVHLLVHLGRCTSKFLLFSARRRSVRSAHQVAAEAGAVNSASTTFSGPAIVAGGRYHRARIFLRRRAGCTPLSTTASPLYFWQPS